MADPAAAALTGPALYLGNCPDGAGDSPGWLTPDERIYWQSFGSDHRRASFVGSRALARCALAQASATCPADWALTAPGIPRVHGGGRWQLSISHAQQQALVGLAEGAPVGVDLEFPQPARRWRDVTRRWFHEDEQRWLLAADSPENFFLCWTLKEAWLKATGRGIADNLQTLRVLCDAGRWGLVGDRPENWCCSVGRWQQAYVAVVWRGHGQQTPLTLMQLEWAQTPDLRVTTARPLAVEWILDREMIGHEFG